MNSKALKAVLCTMILAGATTAVEAGCDPWTGGATPETDTWQTQVNGIDLAIVNWIALSIVNDTGCTVDFFIESWVITYGTPGAPCEDYVDYTTTASRGNPECRIPSSGNRTLVNQRSTHFLIPVNANGGSDRLVRVTMTSACTGSQTLSQAPYVEADLIATDASGEDHVVSHYYLQRNDCH